MPVCARYPYEVWIAPIQPVATFMDLTAEQRSGLAKALKTATLKYDGLWNRPFPYLMAWFQAPLNGTTHPEWHLHAEFYPPYNPWAESSQRESFMHTATGGGKILGKLASEAMTEVLMQAQPNWTEYQLAGAGAEALWVRGLQPILTLAAGDRRFLVD